MHELWIRLFQRTAAKRNLRSFPNALPVYFLIIVGKKRTRLTVQHLRCLQEGGGDEEVISEATEMETASGFSFYTCLSNFRDERTGAETDVTVPLLELRHRFVHYISHSNLQRLATESLEKMHKHFSQGHAWNDQDTMGKFLCPGLGWEVRPDEIGSNLVTAKDLSHMTGYWKNDQNFSDDPGILVDVMEMPWFFKKASKLLNYTQVRADEEHIGLYTKVLGFTFPAMSYYTREGRIATRRDMRKGLSRVSTVLTTFGFRQFVQWGEPYAGFAVVEGQLAQDANSFEMVTWTQRYAGPHCCLRYCPIFNSCLHGVSPDPCFQE